MNTTDRSVRKLNENMINQNYDYFINWFRDMVNFCRLKCSKKSYPNFSSCFLDKRVVSLAKKLVGDVRVGDIRVGESEWSCNGFYSNPL